MNFWREKIRDEREICRDKRGIETFQKTVMDEIRDKRNRDKRGLPVCIRLYFTQKKHSVLELENFAVCNEKFDPFTKHPAISSQKCFIPNHV